MLHRKVVKKGSPKISHHKEFFSVFNFISTRNDECSLNLLCYLFHDMCKSNPYVLHLKFIVLCQIYLRKTGIKN